MGVVLTLKPLDKLKTSYEVGEVGVVQQLGKVRRDPGDEADEERGEEARIEVSR